MIYISSMAKNAAIKKGEIMRLRNITLAGVILLVLAFTIGMASATENGTDNETQTVNATGNSTETLTVPPNTTASPEADDNETEDESLIGPGNALYGLTIAFENIGEIFTFNASEKLGKQVSHARKRIAEARAALKRNDTEAANIALANYDAKMNEINKTMSGLSGKDIGLINAQQMILKHQIILENLSISHPNSTGLLRAYNNSRNLQTKFESKIGQNPDLNSAMDNQAIPKAEKTGVPVKDEKSEKGTRR